MAFGDTTIYGNFNLFYDMHTNGNLTSYSEDYMFVMNTDISNNGNLSILRALTVGTGREYCPSLLNGNLTVTGRSNYTTLQGNLQVQGNTELIGSVRLQGPMDLNGALTMNNTSTFNGDVT